MAAVWRRCVVLRLRVGKWITSERTSPLSVSISLVQELSPLNICFIEMCKKKRQCRNSYSRLPEDWTKYMRSTPAHSQKDKQNLFKYRCYCIFAQDSSTWANFNASMHRLCLHFIGKWNRIYFTCFWTFHVGKLMLEIFVWNAGRNFRIGQRTLYSKS